MDALWGRTMKMARGRATLPMTYDEYALLPQDRKRYEVIEGELYVTPSPIFDHQFIVTVLAEVLSRSVRLHNLGVVCVAPMDVVLNEFNVFQPDILFLRAGRAPSRGAKNITVAPDLIVEVLSPSTMEEDRNIKMRVYARHGVLNYWIVDPDARTLEMYALEGDAFWIVATFSGDAEATTPLFPGLTIPLARLWP